MNGIPKYDCFSLLLALLSGLAVRFCSEIHGNKVWADSRTEGPRFQVGSSFISYRLWGFGIPSWGLRCQPVSTDQSAMCTACWLPRRSAEGGLTGRRLGSQADSDTNHRGSLPFLSHVTSPPVCRLPSKAVTRP